MAKKKAHLTREQWLTRMATALEHRLLDAEYEMDTRYRVSCGLPSRGAFGKNLRTVGQAWHPKCSADGVAEIFISPTVSDSVEVAATLAHELVHVCVGNEAGHGPEFKRCATAIGLEGKMTATVAGKELVAYIKEGIEKLGEYPHAELVSTQRKKQSTRMLKVTCTDEACLYQIAEGKPYTVRMSRTVLEYAAPKCGCCGQEMEEA